MQGAKVVNEGEGREKIKVGDKECETKWIKLKSTTTFNNKTVESSYKMWFSKDVPMSGLVRLVTFGTTTSDMTTKVELTGFGRK
jgi:hypothetical protein